MVMFPRAELKGRLSRDFVVFVAEGIGGLAVPNAHGRYRGQGGGEAEDDGGKLHVVVAMGRFLCELFF